MIIRQGSELIDIHQKMQPFEIMAIWSISRNWVSQPMGNCASLGYIYSTAW